MVGVCPNLSLKAGRSNPEVTCMTHTLDKIRKHVPEALEPGEEFVAATPIVAADHDAKREALRHGGGILNMAVGQAVGIYEAKKDSAHLGDVAKVDVHIGEHGAYAVATNQRFLVFSESMTGAPKNLLGAWPVDGVSVETDVHRAGGFTQVESLRFLLPDHTMLAAESSERSHGDQAEELVAILSQAA